MKLGVTDIIALVKAGYKMSDIKALQEETEEKPEEKPKEKPEEKPKEKPKEKPSVDDLKNQIRDLTNQIKTMQETNKDADVSKNVTNKKSDEDLMLDLFRTFM